MRFLNIFLLLITINVNAFTKDYSVKDLTIEHKKNPIGIDASVPRFSWKISE
jgi:hypothetical protein